MKTNKQTKVTAAAPSLLWNFRCFCSPEGFSDRLVVLANKAELSAHLRHVTLFVWSSEEEFSTPRIPQRARLNSCCQDTGGSGSAKKHIKDQREDLEPHWACSIMQSLKRIQKSGAELVLWLSPCLYRNLSRWLALAPISLALR